MPSPYKIGLSPREQQFVDLRREGLKLREIAERCGVTEITVKNTLCSANKWIADPRPRYARLRYPHWPRRVEGSYEEER